MPEARRGHLLSDPQLRALVALAAGPLVFTVTGYCADLAHAFVGPYHGRTTVTALEQRGLCSVTGVGRRCRAAITAAGREEFARRRETATTEEAA